MVLPMYISYVFLYITAGMTNNENTDLEMKFVIKNWLTVIVLMVAFAIASLYDALFNNDWIELLVKRSMDIFPAVIGLILQSSYRSFYFKRTLLKVTSPIVKRMTLNNHFISFAKRCIATLTIVNLTVEGTFSTSVSEINLVPFISVPVFFVLFGLNEQCYPRTINNAILSLVILTASFDYSDFATELIYFVTVLNSNIGVICGIWIGHYGMIIISIFGFLC